MPKYEVIRSYTVSDVYHVIADNEEHAYKQACEHEYEWHKSYDGGYDDAFDVRLLEEKPS